MTALNKLIVAITELMPTAWVGHFAKRYIAGENIESAVDLVKTLNQQGIYTTIDVLGESINNKTEAIEAKNKAMEVLDSIEKFNLLSNLSVKPTQMGIVIDENFAYEQIAELMERSKKINTFVRIDMEDSSTTDATIRVFKRLLKSYDNVGIVVQAYLKRTMKDVDELNKLGTDYRVCKGIYIESPDIAYKDRRAVQDNFMEILESILKNRNYVGIATHDDYLVEKSYELLKKLNVPKDMFEFQMLLGVKENLRDRINADGYKIRVYIPFGKDWYAYSIRRLKENPNIAGHIFKNIFRLN